MCTGMMWFWMGIPAFWGENELTDIDFASELTALEKIDLSENYVTQLRPLSGLAALRQVICRGNPVSNERVLGDKVMLIME